MYSVVWELRTAHGYTLRQLEEISGVSKTEINNIENGKTNPTVATLQLLANALEVELIELLRVQLCQLPPAIDLGALSYITDKSSDTIEKPDQMQYNKKSTTKERRNYGETKAAYLCSSSEHRKREKAKNYIAIHIRDKGQLGQLFFVFMVISAPQLIGLPSLSFPPPYTFIYVTPTILPASIRASI